MPEATAGIGNLESIFISLYVADTQCLVVLLAADGSVNRLGTGEMDNRERDLFIGITDPLPFQTLASQADPAWFQYSGQQYELPDQQGAHCKLRLILKSSAAEHAFEFLYGSDSEGPPEEFARFVVSAVELTNPWYEEQKAHGSKKAWWKFW